MKNIFFHVSRVAALTVCALGTVHLRAATVPKLLVTVPFDFVAGKKTLPAGNYSITSASSIGSPVFLVRNEATGNTAVVLMNERTWPEVKGAQGARAVFGCREETCFLSQLQVPGWDSFAAFVPKLSAAQKERQVALDLRSAPVGK